MATRVLKSYRLFVGNLPWTVSPAELRNYFRKFGELKNSRIIFSKSGWSRGYGFVAFEKENDYKSVFNQKDHFLGGQMISVNPTSKNNKTQPDDNDLDNELSE